MRGLLLVAMGSIFFCTGCATIVGGTDQPISVDSNVKSADVYYNGALVGQTPFNGRVKKTKSPTLLVSKTGYAPRQQILSTTTPTIFWGNIIIGGFLGSTTDLATGAMFEISPSSYYINLEAQPATNQPEAKKSSRYDFQKDTEIKRYSMLNYSHLSVEIKHGQGEYLDGLQKLIAVGKKTASIEDLRQIEKANQAAVPFGEAVAGYYFSKL